MSYNNACVFCHSPAHCGAPLFSPGAEEVEPPALRTIAEEAPRLLCKVLLRSPPRRVPSHKSRAGGSGDVNLISVSGASLLNVLAALPHNLNGTFIAYGEHNVVWTLDMQGDPPAPLNPANPANYAASPSINALGRVAYDLLDYNSLNTQIFVVNGDGTGAHRVTDGSSYSALPTWMADNATILFTQYNGSANQIAKVSGGGGTATVLNPTSVGDDTPTVAPDGTVAYRHLNTSDGHYEIWTMSSTGTGAHEIMGNTPSVDYNQPSFSPDGAMILAQATPTSNPGQIVLALRTGGYNAITSPSSPQVDSWPSWAPDGKHILYVHFDGTNYNLIEAFYDGTFIKTLHTTKTMIQHPVWSPYLANKLYVGTGGTFGNSSNGFILGQMGDSIISFVNVLASSGAQVNITQDPQNPMVERITMATTGTITNLLYNNNFFSNASSVPVTGAKQVVVSFDSSGQVSLVLPIASKMNAVKAKTGNGTVYSGQILGVWDAKKNRNLAPGGAKAVAIGAGGKLVDLK